jgi:hypothetical protein
MRRDFEQILPIISLIRRPFKFPRQTVMETDMETEMDMKRKWTWKRKRKLYLIRRNSPYSAVRIVANIAVAE